MVVNGTLPENYSIKHWHNEQEYGEYQVHDEANRSPNGAFYVHPTGANTLIEVVDVVAVKMGIRILVQDLTEVNIYASYAMRLFGYQCNKKFKIHANLCNRTQLVRADTYHKKPLFFY